MNRKLFRKAFALFITIMLAASITACGSKEAGESTAASEEGAADKAETAAAGEKEEGSGAALSSGFAKAHDAFTTTLVREENDDDQIPEPPEGVFDLVSYSSKAGDLAAYVSSDPGDGEKHPMIIWVVGGWGNGIDDFPFTYPDWEDDQTGSAFWQAGILTMYPSFRGGNGNPGYYEALFGEVDDIVSAYEYAAALPYVDPERIYLGGHSTGGTRALLASEYTDKFRAVFCFGAVDDITYHNNDQFTFDTDNEEEYKMRSPIHWLDDVKSPTFLIEGRDGNSDCLERMKEASQNDQIHCYVIENADHFSVLAPLTRLAAEKILADTGAEPAISITQEELDQAMEQEIPLPVPVMTKRRLEDPGITFSCPYIWDVLDSADGNGYEVYSRYEYDNAWDMSTLQIEGYPSEEAVDLQMLKKSMEDQEYLVNDMTIDGRAAIDAIIAFRSDNGETYYQRYVSVENGEEYVDFNFLTYGDYMEEANSLFQDIIESIAFED